MPDKKRHNCQKATLLADIRLYRPLKPLERLALYAHLLQCSPCRRYMRQGRLIDNAFRAQAQEIEAPSPMPSAYKEKLQSRLQELIANN